MKTIRVESLMKKFHIVGAFDRHNYGDVLFALIHQSFIEQWCQDEYEITFYAISSADMQYCGGFRTQALSAFFEKERTEDDRLVLAGGDILGADWPDMISHICEKPVAFMINLTRRFFSFKTYNALIRSLYGQKNQFPYIVSRKDTKAKIYYTCVGGSNFNVKSRQQHIEMVCDELKTCQRVSVRERETQRMLESGGVVADLIPDSALLMSVTFPKEQLAARSWHTGLIERNYFTRNNFFVFQIARHYVKDELLSIVDQLKKVHAMTGWSVLLLPIGRAPGHEDDVILKQIFEKLLLASIPVALQNSPHVLDIMACLALSNAYIGTSLHGAITSYAFGNKVCGIATDRVPKLKNFLNTWLAADDYAVCPSLDFAGAFGDLVHSGGSITSSAELVAQQELVINELKRYLE